VDRSGLLLKLHAELVPQREPYERIFVVLEGRREQAPTDGLGADYPGALHVETVRYAGFEGPGCDARWDGFRYRAHGNEPFWSAEVSPSGFRLGRLGEAELGWQDILEESGPEGIRFAGTGGPGRGTVELAISRAPCRDSMSGAYFALSAWLRLRDEKLVGCALPGADAAQP
jgi:uncharacterized membrane protein